VVTVVVRDEEQPRPDRARQDAAHAGSPASRASRITAPWRPSNPMRGSDHRDTSCLAGRPRRHNAAPFVEG